jgi:AcrR family transcriptional regulator
MIAGDTQEPRWRRLPEERPRQIIEAALDVFGEHGLAAARLEDIARRAGVSKGTIYLYFPNKEALFCEMVRVMVGASIERAQARTDTAAPAAEQLAEYVRGVWQYVRSPLAEKMQRLVLGELQGYPHLLDFFFREVSQRSLALVADIIRRGIASGEFRDTDPVVAARMLHAIMIKHGLWCAQREHVPFLQQLSDDDVLAQILDFFHNAIRRVPDASSVTTHA